MQRKINEHPGVVVCICSKSGQIAMHDPGRYLRELREVYARAKKEEEENDDDDG